MRSLRPLLLPLLLLACAKEPTAASPAAGSPSAGPPVSVGLSAPQPAPAAAADSVENSVEQTVLFSPLVACTRMMCPENSCCNTCTFLRWSKGRLEAEAAPGAEPLPSCTPDGCGACPSQLSATGQQVDAQFIVSRWSLVPMEERPKEEGPKASAP
jgi:hypothetical protein